VYIISLVLPKCMTMFTRETRTTFTCVTAAIFTSKHDDIITTNT